MNLENINKVEEKIMKNQVVGSVFIVSLILFITCLDRLINLKFEIGQHIQLFGVGIVSFVISALFLLYIKRKEKCPDKSPISWKEKVILIVGNSCSGSILDILVILSFFAFVAWIPDAVTDFTKEGICPIRPFVYLLGLVIMVWGKPATYVKGPKITEGQRRLLLTGMSNISIREGSPNIIPMIKPFGVYPNIDTVVILLSDSILKYLERLNPDLNKMDDDAKSMTKALRKYKNRIAELGLTENDKLKKGERVTDEVKWALAELLTAYIKGIYPSYKDKEILIIFSAPVDCNKFKLCNDECFNILNYVMQGGGQKRKYTDDDIVVNTTPGTSVVTSVLTINAIKGSRAMVYTNQDTYELEKDADPDVTLIQFEGWMREKEKQTAN